MAEEKEYIWHRVMEAGTRGIDFMQERQIRKVLVLDRYLVMVRSNDRLFALKAKCPHSGGPMEHSMLDEQCNLVCPWHRFKFSIETGKNVSGEGYYLENYPVEIRDNMVYVGFARKRLFGIF